MNFFRKIEWANFLFITLSPVVAIGGTVWLYLAQDGVRPATWILAFILSFATGLGITGGYHRLFSHRSYQAHPFVRFVFLLLGGASFEGSAREWACAHRKHHRFVDTDQDPYNIKRGFWYAHVGWVVMKADQSDESRIKDLLKDPLILFQDKYYIPLAALISLVLPTLLAGLWGDFLGGFFVAGWLRIVFNHHLTFLINSWCHYFGKQPFSDSNTARDSGIVSFFTFGEGYHNFHHAFEGDYRNGIRPFDWDPGKWLIASLSWLRLATNLKTVSPKKILEAKLCMDEKRFRQRIEHPHPWIQVVERAKTNTLNLYARLQELRVEYKKTKMIELKREIRRLKLEFREALQQWHQIMQGQVPALANISS